MHLCKTSNSKLKKQEILTKQLKDSKNIFSLKGCLNSFEDITGITERLKSIVSFRSLKHRLDSINVLQQGTP
jgi:hypothetical protein